VPAAPLSETEFKRAIKRLCGEGGSKDDLAVIVTCFTEKGWTGTWITKEFLNKMWNYPSINLD